MFGAIVRSNSRWLVVFSLLVCSMPAAVVRRNKVTVTVPPGETIDDTLIAMGEVIRIDGDVNGDVIALGKWVEVRGHIKGTLVSLAQETEVRGSVDGDVVTGGQSVAVYGPVKGNWYAGGQNVTLEPGGSLEGDLIGAAQELEVEGVVKRSVEAAAASMTVAGTIGRDLTFMGDSVDVGSGAKIGGRLKATVDHRERVLIDSGATVAGGKAIEIRQGHAVRAPHHFSILGVLFEFFSALLAGLVLILIAPVFFGGAAENAGRPWSVAIGLAVLVAGPIAMLVVGITIIGLPLALLALAAYLCALYLAKIVVAGFLGQAILRSTPANRMDWFIALLIGLAILTAAFRIPYGIGVLFRVVTICFGLGALGWRLVRPQPESTGQSV
jgi:cytoskeletal protein CcmA (bactofilin family)